MLKILSDPPTGGESNGLKITKPEPVLAVSGRSESNDQIRVRYAPSPTGVPHIGNIRTALFNYLFAQKEGGQFLLRIEDTDRTRLVPEAVDKIKQSLELLGLQFAEEEIYQSKRLELYHKYLETLKEKSLAYEDEGAWRYKVEKGKTLSWNDAVHGKVEFKSDVIEDFIIIKSDGYPTYHFANVIDDHETKISHVFRGDEWIPSTPKHLLLYEAFGWDPPAFVHLPAILGPDHKKLSKRQGAKSVIEFIQEGYLPEAIINFLAFLGWAPKDNREIFSLGDLTNEFSIDRINKNSPVFNLEKLQWYNGQWIKKLELDDLTKRLALEFPNYNKEKIREVVPLVNSRIFTLKDFAKIAGFFFEKPNVDPLLASVPLSENQVASVVAILESVPVSDWVADHLKSQIAGLAEKEKVEPKDLFRGIGIAVSGSLITPPLFEALGKLGKEETIKRLKDVAEKLS